MSLFCCLSTYKLTLLSISLMSYFCWPPPAKLIMLFVCTWANFWSFSIFAYHVVFYGRDYCVVHLCMSWLCCPLRMSWLCCPSTCSRILLSLCMSLYIFWYPSAHELFYCPFVYYLILLAILLACLLLICTWLISYAFCLKSVIKYTSHLK
jgi:hypothetical protein